MEDLTGDFAKESTWKQRVPRRVMGDRRPTPHITQFHVPLQKWALFWRGIDPPTTASICKGTSEIKVTDKMINGFNLHNLIRDGVFVYDMDPIIFHNLFDERRMKI